MRQVSKVHLGYTPGFISQSKKCDWWPKRVLGKGLKMAIGPWESIEVTCDSEIGATCGPGGLLMVGQSAPVSPSLGAKREELSCRWTTPVRPFQGSKRPKYICLHFFGHLRPPWS